MEKFASKIERRSSSNRMSSESPAMTKVNQSTRAVPNNDNPFHQDDNFESESSSLQIISVKKSDCKQKNEDLSDNSDYMLDEGQNDKNIVFPPFSNPMSPSKRPQDEVERVSGFSVLNQIEKRVDPDDTENIVFNDFSNEANYGLQHQKKHLWDVQSEYEDNHIDDTHDWEMADEGSDSRYGNLL